MRVTQDYSLRNRCVQYANDVPGGGCEVLTPSGLTLIIYGICDGKPWFDPVDQKEMFYPGWAEW